MRIYKDKHEEENSKETNTKECIDWAFAGRSHTTPQGGRKDGMIQLSHTIWEHWIDSKSNNPGPDEGDMLVQENGDVLERGKQKHPVTGAETEYEELWHDLEVDAFGKKQNRSSLVLRAEQPESDVRGMAIKIGGWCQGILKAGDALTVERWEWKSGGPNNDETSTEGGKQAAKTRNGWVRTFKYGEGSLPCEEMCDRTTGKFGLHAVVKRPTTAESTSETEWKVIEEYYW